MKSCEEKGRDHHHGHRYANACAGKSKNFQVLSQLIVVNIYASMCKLANEIQMCPKSEPTSESAQLDLVAIPRPARPLGLSRLSASR